MASQFWRLVFKPDHLTFLAKPNRVETGISLYGMEREVLSRGKVNGKHRREAEGAGDGRPKVSGVRGAFDWRLIFELSGYAALR
jgi:hypothetical protein